MLQPLLKTQSVFHKDRTSGSKGTGDDSDELIRCFGVGWMGLGWRVEGWGGNEEVMLWVISFNWDLTRLLKKRRFWTVIAELFGGKRNCIHNPVSLHLINNLYRWFRGKNMNFLYDLTSGWYECQGYFILWNIKFGLSLKGVNSWRGFCKLSLK